MKASELLAEGRRRAPGLVLRGLCMGTADVIPGVSGGTIALITGIYDELVGTIAAVDQRLVSALVRGRLIEVLHRVNASFLVPLLLRYRLGHYLAGQVHNLAVGNAPSARVGLFHRLDIGQRARGRAAGCWMGDGTVGADGDLGAVVGYAITTLVPVETGVEGYKFALAGMVAICAMILPGISGSFLLVVMGKYQQVLTAVHEFDWAILALFGVGAVMSVCWASRGCSNIC